MDTTDNVFQTEVVELCRLRLGVQLVRRDSVLELPVRQIKGEIIKKAVFLEKGLCSVAHSLPGYSLPKGCVLTLAEIRNEVDGQHQNMDLVAWLRTPEGSDLVGTDEAQIKQLFSRFYRAAVELRELLAEAQQNGENPDIAAMVRRLRNAEGLGITTGGVHDPSVRAVLDLTFGIDHVAQGKYVNHDGMSLLFGDEEAKIEKRRTKEPLIPTITESSDEIITLMGGLIALHFWDEVMEIRLVSRKTIQIPYYRPDHWPSIALVLTDEDRVPQVCVRVVKQTTLGPKPKETYRLLSIESVPHGTDLFDQP